MSTVSGQPSSKPCITFKNTSAAKNDAPSRKYCPSGTQGPAKDIKIGDSPLKEILDIFKAAKYSPGYAVRDFDNVTRALLVARKEGRISDNTAKIAEKLLNSQMNMAPGSGAPAFSGFSPEAFVGMVKATAENGENFVKSVFPESESVQNYTRSHLNMPLDNNPNNVSYEEAKELTFLGFRKADRYDTRLYEAFLQYGQETK